GIRHGLAVGATGASPKFRLVGARVKKVPVPPSQMICGLPGFTSSTFCPGDCRLSRCSSGVKDSPNNVALAAVLRPGVRTGHRDNSPRWLTSRARFKVLKAG